MTDFSAMLQPDKGQPARIIHVVDKTTYPEWLAAQPERARTAILAQGMKVEGYAHAILPGDGALIAGLTIDGNTTLRLLARAVGPGLAPFGVTDALADPTLTLYAAGSSTPMATNDDWADVQSIVGGESLFRRVGAFDLVPGSRDAVIVTRLPPGAYTVKIEGKNGATGVALLEIYEVP